MKITPALVSWAAEAFIRAEDAKRVAERLASLDDITRECDAANARLTKARRAFEAEQKAAAAALAALRDRCPHPPSATAYHPDPSGNNDSYRECLVCGREW